MQAEGCSPTTHPMGLAWWPTHICFLQNAIMNYHKQGSLKQHKCSTFIVLWVRSLHRFQRAKTQMSTGLHPFFGDSWGKFVSLSFSSLWGLLHSLTHGPFIHLRIQQQQVEAPHRTPLTLLSSPRHFCSLPPLPFLRIFLIMLSPPESSPYFNISWLATLSPVAL